MIYKQTIFMKKKIFKTLNNNNIKVKVKQVYFKYNNNMKMIEVAVKVNYHKKEKVFYPELIKKNIIVKAILIVKEISKEKIQEIHFQKYRIMFHNIVGDKLKIFIKMMSQFIQQQIQIINIIKKALTQQIIQLKFKVIR